MTTLTALTAGWIPRLPGLPCRMALLASVSISAAHCGAAGGVVGQANAADSSPSELVGNPAPNFNVKAVNANTAAGASGAVSLQSLRGKVVLVDFWGTFCEPCKRSFPQLQDLSAKYVAQGLHVVGISEDEVDDKGKIPGFADTYGAKFPLAWDEDKAIARAYKPETLPSSFLIDKRGVVRYAHIGYHDGEELELDKEVKELLAK